jgi:hypothetical protein
MGLIKVFRGENNSRSQGFRKLLLLRFSSSLFSINVKIVPDEFQWQIADLECNEYLKLNFVLLQSYNYINSLHLVLFAMLSNNAKRRTRQLTRQLM